MALFHSPQIVTDGLALYLDAANRKSTINAAPASVITSSGWTAGSGGITGFNQNGSTVENERVLATDPWGNNSIVWETRPTGTTDADGGWNSDYFSIDRTKLYRFSVWVRRTSSTSGGTFYLGTGAGGQEVMRTDNGAEQGNPYWECEGTGVLTQNVWYLVCGHVYPYNTTYTGRHPDTGFFTIANGPSRVRDVNGCNIGNDLKWAPGSTSALHRTYHYYCSDSTTRLQFAFPRVDICDGNEPSVNELLNNGPGSWRDLSGNNRTGTWYSPPSFTSAGPLSYFSTLSNRCTSAASNSFGINNTSGYTIFLVCMQNALVSTGAFKFYSSGPYGRGIFTHCTWSDDRVYFDQGGCCGSDTRTDVNSGGSQTWNIWAFRRLTGSSTRNIFKNGQIIATNTNAAADINLTSTGLDIGSSDEYGGNASTWNARLNAFVVYNRGLTDDEVLQVFNALRGRFSL